MVDDAGGVPISLGLPQNTEHIRTVINLLHGLLRCPKLPDDGVVHGYLLEKNNNGK